MQGLRAFMLIAVLGRFYLCCTCCVEFAIPASLFATTIDIVDLRFTLSTCPSFPVEGTVLNCFGEVVGFDVGACVKIGNGSGYFEDTIVSTGRKTKTLHGGLQQLLFFF